MKIIYTKKREEILVDDEDYEFLNGLKWFIAGGYAKTSIKRKRSSMHIMLMGSNIKDGYEIDHEDRNKLNNQKSNLRICTRAQNQHNTKKKSNTKNNYKGVNYVKRLNLYQSRCRMFGQDHFLGYFKSEIAAAYAYNKKSYELSPEFVLLNNFDIPNEELGKILEKDRAILKRSEHISKYKHIYWSSSKQNWEIKIRFRGRYEHLGNFVNEEEALTSVKIAWFLFNGEKEYNFYKN